MAKRNKKKDSRGTSGSDLPGTKQMMRLLDEIIEESTSAERNLIVLEGKIRDLEDSLGKRLVSFLANRLRQGNVAEQRAILDLLVRQKARAVIEQLQKIGRDRSLCVKVRLQALTYLEEWGEAVNAEAVGDLRLAKDIVDVVEKSTAFGPALEEDDRQLITMKFRKLPSDIKGPVITQILEEHPQEISLALSLIEDESDIDKNIIDILARQATPEVAVLFGKLLGKSENKSLRRVLKKYAYQLKQKGLEVPSAKSEGRPKVRSIEPPRANAYVSPIDYIGERLMFLSKPVLGWGVVFFQIALSDQEGIKTFNVFDLNRKDIRNFLKRVEESGTLQLIEIPPEYCHYLLEEAYQLSLKKRLSLPEQYGQWRAELNELQGGVVEPMIHALINGESLASEDTRIRRASFGSLHELDIFKDWLMEPRTLWEYIEKYREVDSSPLVLNKFQKEERKSSIVLEAVKNIFDDQQRQIYKRRLEEMAYLLYRRGDEVAARLALSAALDLAPDGIPSEQHEFLRALVLKSISFYVEGEKEHRRDNLLIAPR